MAKRMIENTKATQVINNAEVSKEEKDMKVITIELIEAAKAEGKKVQMGRKGTKNEGFAKIDGEQYQIVEKMSEKTKQVHEPKDRDIKIVSGKVGDIGVKLIYHRDSKGEKQFRIYLSKKVEGKLKRVRFQNDDTKKIDRDEKKMAAYYEQIVAGKIKVKVA